ncbi:hypothetical protein V8F20_004965 [Naviculisporaceae sp. PSN 640]
MQLTSIIAIISVALTAVQAAPNPAVLNTRTPNCGVNGGGKKVCCPAGSVLGVLPIVNCILSDTCSDTAFCCETNSNSNSLITVTALNCINL